MSLTIWNRWHQISSARRDKQREAMKEYDETVYYPAVAVLRKECAEVGHHPNGRWSTTVGGVGYQHCGACGATLYEPNAAHDDRSAT